MNFSGWDFIYQVLFLVLGVESFLVPWDSLEVCCDGIIFSVDLWEQRIEPRKVSERLEGGANERFVIAKQEQIYFE